MPQIEGRYELGTHRASWNDNAGETERLERERTINRLLDYYMGDHDPVLKTRPGERDDNIIVNITGQAVDDTLDFVGTPTRFEMPGEDSTVVQGDDLVTVASDVQTALDTLYEAHRGVVRDIVMSLLVAGHAYVKTYVDENGPQFDAIDPRFVTVFTDIADPRKVVFYRQQWKVSDTDTLRQDIIPVNRLDQTAVDLLASAPERVRLGNGEVTHVIAEFLMTRMGAWQLMRVDEWGYSVPPMIDRPINRKAFGYYGLSPFHFAPESNDAYNFVVSNIGRIIKFHAHPRTIVKGVTKDQFQATAVDAVWTIPATGDIYNVEMQSDLASSMNFATALRGVFFTRARVVDSAGLGDKVGQLTNFGLRMLYNQMIDMSDTIRKIVGRLFGNALAGVLLMRGFAVADLPEAVWDDPLPMNRLETLQAAQIEAALGTVSKQTLADDLGRDYEHEQENMREEKQTSIEALANALSAAGDSGFGMDTGVDNGTRDGR
jgi:hypothetical protein